jgi:hypothetical protein
MSLFAIFSGKSKNKPIPNYNNPKNLVCLLNDLDEAKTRFTELTETPFVWVKLVCLSTDYVIMSSISYDYLKPVDTGYYSEDYYN